MQEQVTENNEVQTETPVEATTEQTVEQQEGHIKDMAVFNHTVYRELTKAHLSQFTRIMRAGNGVSQKQKIVAEKALLDVVEMALGFGVDGNETALPEKGQAFAHESANLANALVKAMDNRMLLVALQQKDAESEEQVVETTETTNENV